MARAASSLHRGERRRVRRQPPRRIVQAVDHHLVDAEIAGEEVAERGIEVGAVRVRRFLPLLVDAAARVLHDGRLAQPAVSRHRQHRDGAAAVVGDEQMTAGSIEGQMAGRSSHRRLSIDQRQPAGGAIDREGADRPRRLALVVVDLVDREEQSARAIDGDERRAGGLGGQAERRERRRLPGALVHPERVDALAVRLAAGVGADVDERRHPFRRRRRATVRRPASARRAASRPSQKRSQSFACAELYHRAGARLSQPNEHSLTRPSDFVLPASAGDAVAVVEAAAQRSRTARV